MNKRRNILNIIAVILCITLLFNTSFVYAQTTDSETTPEAVAEAPPAEDIPEEEIPSIEYDDYDAIRTEENEVTSLRTPNSKTYRVDDETMQTVIYTEDIHYLDTSAGYLDINNNITASIAQYGNTKYRLTNAANTYSAHFADESEDELVRINYGGKGISITPVSNDSITEIPVEPPIETTIDIEISDETAAPNSDIEISADAQPNEAVTETTEAETANGTTAADETTEAVPETIEDTVTAEILSSSLEEYTTFTESESLKELVLPENSVLYEDIYPGIDILYETGNYEIKEYIVIKEPTTQNEFLFDYNLYGLTLNIDDEGNITFRDDTGEDIFFIGDLFAIDDSGAITEAVGCTAVSTEGDTARLKVTLDAEYLADPERVFPVIIDPSTMITGSSTTYDTYVSQQNPLITILMTI